MCEEDFKSIGIKKFGERFMLQKFIKEYKNLNPVCCDYSPMLNYNGGALTVEPDPIIVKPKSIVVKKDSCTGTSNDLNTSRDLFEDYFDTPTPHLQNSFIVEVQMNRSSTSDLQNNSISDFPYSSIDEASTSDLQNMNECSVPELQKINVNCSNSKICPICNKTVKVLSKHLNVHGVDNAERHNILYSTRKRKSFTGKVKHCPFPECVNLAGHIRLDHHLIKKHKLSKSDVTYTTYIRHYNKRHKSEEKLQLKGNEFNAFEFAEMESFKFQGYLKSLSGGNLSAFNARQQAYKIRQILKGANINSSEDITGDESKKSFENWLSDYSKTHAFSSAITMCSTLISYLNYLIIICQGDYIAISSFIKMINKWKKAFRGGKSAKDNAHVEISKEEARIFLNSDVHRNVTAQLQAINDGSRDGMLSREEHAHIRDVISLTALFRNGSRPCAIANMTVKEFEAAEFVAKGQGRRKGKYVVFVADHKTKGLHGHAKIVLSKELYNNYFVYYEKIRPHLVGVPSEPPSKLFVTWNGNEFKSEDFGKGIQRAWYAAGLQTKITATDVRKTTTTRVHRDKPELKEGVARHLGHNLSTAESSYKIICKAQESVKSSDVVYEVLTGYTESSDSEDEEMLIVNHSDVIENYISTEETNDCHDDEIPITARLNNKKTRGRSFYTESERILIGNVFSEYVDACLIPTQSSIKQFLREDDRLGILMKSNRCNPLKLKGAIHGLINRRKKAN